ncbi:uncharacterized protein C8R40DRAFT_1240637 [Lentinula edodes]|uniref:uncharacterized protein n=1 Tax=Lentinula edodes TaxID=5353 RepID=UPI001E8D1324|nr:uncharacterized protein C8R40DRAFT_1240637 [Lentinula edodes]KAH7870068.1 hypothetical protein C8R40DRAFT_1240637 [Lentinula edodes]
MPFHESGEMTRVYTVCHHCAAGFVKLAPGQCTVTVYLTPVFVFNFWISFSVSIPFLFVIMQGSQRPSPDVFISYDHGKELIDPEIEAEAQIIAHGMPPMRPTSQAPNGFLTFKQYYCRGTPEEAAAIWNRLPARENQKWRRISEIRRTFSVGTTAQENDIPSLQRPTSRGGQSSPNGHCLLAFRVENSRFHPDYFLSRLHHSSSVTTHNESPHIPHPQLLHPQEAFHPYYPTNVNGTSTADSSTEPCHSGCAHPLELENPWPMLQLPQPSWSSTRSSETPQHSHSLGFPLAGPSWGVTPSDFHHEQRLETYHSHRVYQGFPDSSPRDSISHLNPSFYESPSLSGSNMRHSSGRKSQLSHQWPDSGYTRNLGY